MMRLLMLTPSAPFPLHQGGAIRNFGLMRGLHAAGHEIHLLTFHDDRNDLCSTPLGDICTHIETVPAPDRSRIDRLRDLLVSGQPDLARRLHSASFAEKLTAMLRRTAYDVVQFEGLEMATYLPIAQNAETRVGFCYDAHNAEAALQRAIFAIDRAIPRRWPLAAYSYLQARRIDRFERAVCQAADGVFAVSRDDAAELRRFRPDRPIHVIPNGILADHYDACAERVDLGDCAVTFTGKMDYRPNVDAVRWFTAEILPIIAREVPAVRLYVVGQKPHSQLVELRSHPQVEITGWVPDVLPYLHATDVYIAPLRMGSGTRFKLLEAMATGRAIVASSLAAAGLDYNDALIIADRPAQFAGAVIDLLRDPVARAERGRSNQDWVRAHYDWSVLMPHLLQAYGEIGVG
jgi:glycosyltransferase involved in cell wall biosynthesis